MIELEDIVVEFGANGRRVRAVDGASLSVARGEVLGIVGSSGAGKSTLVRTINLLQRPSSGRVRVDGREITGLAGPALRRERQRIGMIFQHFNLLQTRTVRDNAAFALRVAGHGEDEIAARVPELLKLVGLEDKADAFPSQLSGGQKQRVGIARAVANHPEVLLCDEPTSALDLETAGAILDLLAEINARLGITIVLISHEMAVIKKACTRVAVMDAGRIVEQGASYDIFATPQHPYTRQLVARTFNLEIPERLVREAPGTVVKILFLGEGAEEPLLSQAAHRFGVVTNILHGRIEYVGGRPIGLLVVRLADAEPPTGPAPASAPAGRVAAAVDFLRARAASLEVLHA